LERRNKKKDKRRERKKYPYKCGGRLRSLNIFGSISEKNLKD